MSDEREHKTICRVCLASARKKCTSVFEEYKDSFVYNYINTLANVEIKENDGYPDKICPNCLLDMETAINFKLRCESSNIILQTTSLNSAAATNLELQEIIVKKEECPDEEIQFLDPSIFNFESDLYDDNDEDLKPIVDEANIRKSRAIDLQLQCDDCKNYFKSKCKLRVHWKKVHMLEKLKCTDCKRSFKSIKAYNRHQRDKSQSCVNSTNFRIEGEGKSRLFFCKECSYKSKRMKDMITHWVRHTGDRPFKCDLCSKTCTQQSSLQAHREAAHKEYLLEIPCQYCGKIIKGRSRIYRHLKTHTSKGIKCMVCHKTLKNNNSLRTHMQRHSGVKSYTCEMCAQTFYTSGELANHKRMVHNKFKYIYNCDLCDYKSHRKEAIKKHKLRHGDGNIPCTVCGMFFESTQKLTLHQRRHFDEKKFPCPHCDMKFFKRDSVSKHVKSKHNCTMLVNSRVRVNVKQESPVFVNQYDEIDDVKSPDHHK